MAEGLFDFFSRARGQERRAALEGLLTQFIPPELRPQLGLLAEATPTRAAELAGQSAGRMVQPGLSGWERMAAAGDTLSNMAGVLAPVAAGRAVGMAPVQAVQEGLLGLSATPQVAAVRDYLVDDFGGVTVWTGGAGDPMKAASDRGAWFSEAQDLAQEYAGQTGKVLRAEIDPRRPISFRHAEQPRTIGDIINTALEGAGQGADFEAARPIVNRLSQRYGVEARPLFEYWNNDKDVADLFRALGYDSISAAEKSNMRAQTWGALDPSIISLSDPAAVRGFRVFHGSPHDFPPVRLIEMPDGTRLYQNMSELVDTPQGAKILKEYPLGRFDMSKIGTGEGAQAYGHGLYFAENEGVARGYRDALTTPVDYRGGGYPSADTNLAAKKVADAMGPDSNPANVIASEANKFRYQAQQILAALDGQPQAVKEANARLAASFENIAAEIEQLNPADFKLNRGRMYEVNINANPEDFLDWDKPLSEQPRAEVAVGRYLERALDQPGPINEDVFRRFEGGQMTGADVARMVGTDTAPLREAGIPGIRYLDAGSRSAGDGSRNYVVFDENLIEIVRKYGIAGAATLLGISQADVVQAMQQQQQPQTSGLLGGPQ